MKYKITEVKEHRHHDKLAPISDLYKNIQKYELWPGFDFFPNSL